MLPLCKRYTSEDLFSATSFGGGGGGGGGRSNKGSRQQRINSGQETGLSTIERNQCLTYAVGGAAIGAVGGPFGAIAGGSITLATCTIAELMD